VKTGADGEADGVAVGVGDDDRDALVGLCAPVECGALDVPEHE
jgi:hypothetical protein